MPCRVLEDEIEQLRHQLRETADENGRLYKLLKERDFEIKHLKKKIDEDRFAFTGSAAIVKQPPPRAPKPLGVLRARPCSRGAFPAQQAAGSRGQVPQRECQGVGRGQAVQTSPGNEREDRGGRPGQGRPHARKWRPGTAGGRSGQCWRLRWDSSLHGARCVFTGPAGSP